MYFSGGKLALKTPKTGNYGSGLKYRKIMQALEELFDPSEIEAYDENHTYAGYSNEEALEIQVQKRITAVAATLFNLVIRVDTNEQVNSFIDHLETAVINKVAASTLALTGNSGASSHPDDKNLSNSNLNYRR